MKTQNSFIKINKANWKRREHFDFFRTFDNPFWGITTQVNVTAVFRYCKAYGGSFFCYYLYQSLRAVQAVPAFRRRFVGEEIREYQQIDASVTVLRPDETFGFAYCDFHNTYAVFEQAARQSMKTEKANSGLKSDAERINVVHYSIMPYLSFTHMQHAQHMPGLDSIPKLTFGQYRFVDKQVWLPLAVHVHHSLCDGLDVGKFVATFQRFMEI